MRTWEVALVDTEEDRVVLARDIPSARLWSYAATALEETPRGTAARPPALLLTRMDSIPLTWREREAQLVDVMEGENKYGKPYTRRKVRYGRLDKVNKKKGTIENKPMGVSDWDLLMKLNSWRPKKKKEALSKEVSFVCPSCHTECGFVSRGRCGNDSR